MGVLHQPHYINKKIKRVSRLVILPDYQGIGLGTRFLNQIAKYYINQGFDFTIVTSAKNLISSLRKRPEWCMYSYMKQKPVFKKTSRIDRLRQLRTDCYTAGFAYKKDKV